MNLQSPSAAPLPQPRGADPRSDAALAAAVRAGDASACEALMRRHNRLLFRTARGVLGEDAEAQDVVQDTWLRAFGSLQDFRGDAALGTWLARIALNAALDALRRRGRLVTMDEFESWAETPEAENAMPGPAPLRETPEAAAERGELRLALEAAIDGLPPIYRSVFMLRAVEELSVDAAADCLGVSAEVVKTRFLRARALLREALGAQVEARAPQAYAFAGARCDAVVASVLAELARRGLIRLH